MRQATFTAGRYARDDARHAGASPASIISSQDLERHATNVTMQSLHKMANEVAKRLRVTATEWKDQLAVLAAIPKDDPHYQARIDSCTALMDRSAESLYVAHVAPSVVDIKSLCSTFGAGDLDRVPGIAMATDANAYINICAVTDTPITGTDARAFMAHHKSNMERSYCCDDSHDDF